MRNTLPFVLVLHDDQERACQLNLGGPCPAPAPPPGHPQPRPGVH